MNQSNEMKLEVIAHVFPVNDEDKFTGKANADYPEGRNYTRIRYMDVETGELDSIVIADDELAGTGMENLEASGDLPTRWNDQDRCSENPVKLVFESRKYRGNLYRNFKHVQSS